MFYHLPPWCSQLNLSQNRVFKKIEKFLNENLTPLPSMSQIELNLNHELKKSSSEKIIVCGGT